MENGQTSSFREELIELIPLLRAYARSICRNPEDGDDLAQAAVEKAIRYETSFTMGTNMKAWVFRILRNLFYSDRRRAWRNVPLDAEVAERTLAAADNQADVLDLDDLRRGLAMLEPVQREALILVGAGGLSYEQTAEITGVAIGTVKSRVSRARQALARILDGTSLPIDAVRPYQAMAALLDEFDQCARRQAA